jgi:hypothetical protein
MQIAPNSLTSCFYKKVKVPDHISHWLEAGGWRQIGMANPASRVLVLYLGLNLFVSRVMLIDIVQPFF